MFTNGDSLLIIDQFLIFYCNRNEILICGWGLKSTEYIISKWQNAYDWRKGSNNVVMAVNLAEAFALDSRQSSAKFLFF